MYVGTGYERKEYPVFSYKHCIDSRYNDFKYGLFICYISRREWRRYASCCGLFKLYCGFNG